jgi:hypothetical protein
MLISRCCLAFHIALLWITYDSWTLRSRRAGSDKSRSPEAQLAADKEDDVEGTSRWVDDDVGNNEASDSQDEEAQADKSPVDDHRDDEPSASDADTAPKLLDMLQQCRNKDEIFEILKEIGSGTYGSVSKYAAWPSTLFRM